MGWNITYTHKRETLECYAWQRFDVDGSPKIYLSRTGEFTVFSSNRIESSFRVIRIMIDSYNRELFEDFIV